MHCFNVGLDTVKNLPFDVIGSLDADITFGPDYFDFLMGKLSEQLRGSASPGTPFVENGRQSQLPVHECRARVGCVPAVSSRMLRGDRRVSADQGGGIDWVAVTTARLKGWQTRTFTEKTCLAPSSHRNGFGRQFGAFFRHGKKDYYLGGHPLWQVLRCAYQATRPPHIIGGLLSDGGLLGPRSFSGRSGPIPQEARRLPASGADGTAACLRSRTNQIVEPMIDAPALPSSDTLDLAALSGAGARVYQP